MTPKPDFEVQASSIHGKGVFAKFSFDTGEIILVIDDSRIVNDVNPLRPELEEYDYHCDYLAGGTTVLMQFPERHINASCDPNAIVKTINGIRHVVARRSIAKGEEITYDYIIDCHGGDVWQCNCGSYRCRGTIVSSFFELPSEWQREYLPLLNPWFVNEHRTRIEELRQRLGV